MICQEEELYIEKNNIILEGGFLMKVKASVKPICDKCKIIKRHGKVRIICENPNISRYKDNNRDKRQSEKFLFKLY